MRILVLRVDGSSIVESVSHSKQAYNAILECETCIVLRARPNAETFFKNVPFVRGYIGSNQDEDAGSINAWVDFLDATGLMDDALKCIHGHVIIVGRDGYGDCDVPEFMIDMVRDYHDVPNRWGHLKKLTIEYNRLKKCNRYECDDTECSAQCQKCKSVMYCSRECQIKDWPSHKADCLDLTDDACAQQ
jgi:hypothetical protein